MSGPATTTPMNEPFLTREVAAPRHLVLKAWTDPKAIAQWWGGAGSTLTVKALDLRPGGMFLSHQAGPGPMGAWGRFIYREVASPEKLAFVSSFTDAEGTILRAPFSDTWPLEILNEITFTEQDGRTTVAMSSGPINASEAEIAQYREVRPMLVAGFAGTFAQLDTYLARS